MVSWGSLLLVILGAMLLARLVIEYGVILFDVGVNAKEVDVTARMSDDMDVVNFIVVEKFEAVEVFSSWNYGEKDLLLKFLSFTSGRESCLRCLLW